MKYEQIPVPPEYVPDEEEIEYEDGWLGYPDWESEEDVDYDNYEHKEVGA